MLLEHGADPSVTDNVGRYTACQYASHYNHPLLVRLLVSYGANIHYCNPIAKPVTFYGSKREMIAKNIKYGLSDLYIHRSVCAKYLNTISDFELNFDIAFIIVTFIPRHQFPTEKPSFFINDSKELNNELIIDRIEYLQKELMNKSKLNEKNEFVYELFDDFDNELDIRDELLLNKESQVFTLDNLLLIDFIQYFDSFYSNIKILNNNNCNSNLNLNIIYFYLRKIILVFILLLFQILNYILIYFNFNSKLNLNYNLSLDSNNNSKWNIKRRRKRIKSKLNTNNLRLDTKVELYLQTLIRKILFTIFCFTIFFISYFVPIALCNK